ncbi:flagellar hook-associated protein FlgK [Botrimarina mediterranea]|uniref:Flagellar hook-associated protein 1 n=1 Tax=Botrimarina mediterranea TaxID=2528022 RepID=A0A518K4I0_9BACT|nr:flagellar hook-associated protein FlgK [Botrimarina mediterranea]QDV72690.1 Flagellar hook-associated protein 1 [Botrimarina mediterranea]
MSLFGTLQTSSNTLQAMQIGLQVVSNNIANANTPGFIREKANFTPAPIQRLGSLNIGLGVMVDSITQVTDNFLADQLRNASSDRVSADIQNNAYKGLEQLLGELSDSDLSTALTEFFGSIEDTVNPTAGDAMSVRNLAVLEGSQLADEIRRIENRAKDLRDSYDTQITQSVGQINQLTEQIAKLNVQITQVEGGSAGKSDAGALRSTRQQAVNKLTELVSATVVEQPSGGLSIAVGGEFLVFEGQRRDVALETSGVAEEAQSQLIFVDTGKELDIRSGRIQGLSAARDVIVDGFRESLNDFAATMIHEFNLAYSQGQGLEGFKTLTSVENVDDASLALDAAGLAFAPKHGSFEIAVENGDAPVANSTIRINLREDGSELKSTLANIAAQINAVEGLNASVNSEGRLIIEGQSDEVSFTFAKDTSGFLASIGLNTFFTGSGSIDMSVNQELSGIRNADKLALSLDGPGGTTRNATALASLIDKPLDSLDGASITERYDQVVNELAQNSTVAGSVADGLGVFEATLANEFQAVSGVNIDEEAIEMISLQRIYQATARVISTIQEMLDTLVNL